jgi:chain length determinant protein EpsF
MTFLTLEKYLLIIRARLAITISVLGATILIALAISYTLPTLYTASATVVVDAKPDPVGGLLYTEQLLSSYIATQVDIISSERVAERVVKMLKLDEVPAFRQQWQRTTEGRGDFVTWLARSLEKRLTVTPSRESNVITISVRWPDPKASAALANAFAQSYVDTNIELKVDPAKQYAQWFDERSRVLRADVEAKQKRLSDFQKETGLIATDERLDVENARLNELSTQLVSIQAQREESQSRQRQVNGDNESLPEVLQSPLIASLKADLSRAESQQQDIASRLGRNHPDYQTALREVDSIRSRIRQESDKIAASLGSTTQINMRRESDIRAALESQKRRILDLKHQHDEATILENDVATAQRNLDAVTQRLAQVSLESQTQQTNIVLLTPASEPIEPSSPRVALNLLVSIFAGIVLGIFAAFLREWVDERIRSDNQLRDLIDAPFLGKIGRVAFESLERHSLPAVVSLQKPSVI